MLPASGSRSQLVPSGIPRYTQQPFGRAQKILGAPSKQSFFESQKIHPKGQPRICQGATPSRNAFLMNWAVYQGLQPSPKHKVPHESLIEARDKGSQKRAQSTTLYFLKHYLDEPAPGVDLRPLAPQDDSAPLAQDRAVDPPGLRAEMAHSEPWKLFVSAYASTCIHMFMGPFAR